MDKMLRAISDNYYEKTITIELKDGGLVSGYIDTMYETDNGLEFEDEDYLDFHAFALAIVNILKHSAETKPFMIGNLMEFSIQNPPAKISLEDGTVIWEESMGL